MAEQLERSDCFEGGASVEFKRLVGDTRDVGFGGQLAGSCIYQADVD